MRVRVWLILLAIAIGITGGLTTSDDSEAVSTLSIRWMAGVNKDLSYCFGVSGWHDADGTAADIFADSVAPCNDPNGASDQVWSYTYGQSNSAATQFIGIVSYDTMITTCSVVRTDVWRINADSSYTFIGSEHYFHTSPSGSLPIWYTIYLGAGSWQFTQTPSAIGNSVYPDPKGCATTAFHIHQKRATVSSWVSFTKNTSLVTNTIYGLLTVGRYIHQWQWTQ